MLTHISNTGAVGFDESRYRCTNARACMKLPPSYAISIMFANASGNVGLRVRALRKYSVALSMAPALRAHTPAFAKATSGVEYVGFSVARLKNGSASGQRF